ncbi:protein Aster-C-like isoform X2 [Penaeus chinensis]|uniref:protein Aster-C-like isoform X2 n=1 Tax=Penaeus chinensis TaxID=139456 RepID=UPI001FB7BE85|nr:protein Aster-C-like isoform X2 [Penaeus chinensis]
MTLEENGVPGSDGEERAASFIPAGDVGGARRVSELPPTAMFPLSVSRTRLDKEDSTESDEMAGEPSLACPLEPQHQGKVLLSAEVSLTVDAVFALLFRQDQFMTDVYAARKTSDVTSSPWQDQEGEPSTRTVTYNMALSLSTIGAKASFVTETQTLQSSQPGQVFVVETDSVNSGIPYADAFSVFNHYCLTRKSNDRTHIRVWSSIKYKKQMWGFVRGMLEKNVYAGVEALLAEMASQLSAEANKSVQQTTVRRRRRGTNAMGRSRPEARPQPMPETPREKSHWLVIIILVALIILALGNMVLFVKLWRLEQQSSDHKTPLLDTPAVRYLGMTGSWEVVARILQHQELLHESQVEQWKATVSEANQKLLQIYDSLEQMLTSVPEHVETLRLALLHNAAQATPETEGEAPERTPLVSAKEGDQDPLADPREPIIQEQ